MIQISNLLIKAKQKYSNDELLTLALKKIISKYKLKAEQIKKSQILKKSIDARAEICYNLQIILELKNKNLEKEFISRFPSIKEYHFKPLVFVPTTKPLKILVVGAGPSGLFNALVLGECGHNVTLIEQGEEVLKRKEIVEEFFKNGKLNPLTNVQFGEGGAGTFSDGKLNTGNNSVYNQFVLEKFVEFGASQEILIEAKPHIGTDVLINCLLNFRKSLEQKNVNIRFNHQLVDFEISKKKINAKIKDFKTNEILQEDYEIIVLATGHSAKATYQMLLDKVVMEPKPFAMGVRIEHPQELINKALYHEASYLPPAAYKLVKHLPNGRTVYSFCMCPGGEVVNASSEEGHLVINGMSNQKRNGKYANSALLVNIDISDFYQGHPLDGLFYQEKYEKMAFELLNGKVIIQKLADFLTKTKTTSLNNEPSIRSQYGFACLDKCLPDFVINSLLEAVTLFNEDIQGFNDPEALIYGIETRSSAPVRIKRNENYSSSAERIFPIGEGAGYAGGIMTSAVDGIKAALTINKLAEELK